MDLFDIGEGYRSLDVSLSRVKCPVMVISVQTDILYVCFYIFQAMDFFDIGEGYRSLDVSLSRVKCPVMVISVQTDILYVLFLYIPGYGYL